MTNKTSPHVEKAKSTLWLVGALAVGMFLASYDFNGKTPLQHAQLWWKQRGTPTVKSVVRTMKSSANNPPKEMITHEERQGLNKLLAKRSKDND